MHLRRSALAVVLVLMMGMAMAAPAGAAADPKTKLVSLRSNGGPANGDSEDATISDSGRYVAFESVADNLSGQDDNDWRNIFVHDRSTGQTRLVSKRSNGNPADDHSYFPEISGNGRFVCFESYANNLSGQDHNAVRNVFVHDLETRRTRAVSLPTNGEPANEDSGDCSISDRGHRVAFESDANNMHHRDDDDYRNVFVRDLDSRRTILVSKKNDGNGGEGNSDEPALSGSGRRVAFESLADDLPGQDASGPDIFVHDLESRRTKWVSRRTNGDAGNDWSHDPAMSNARYVTFESWADNLVGDDNNNELDIFVHDLKTRRTRLVSRRSDGVLSNGFNTNPGMSGNGRFVLFRSEADNLSGQDDNNFTNIFVHDRETGRTRAVSLRSSGGAADGDSSNPEPSGHRTISETGVWVTFHSEANNLSTRDNDDYWNVFVRGPLI